MIWVQIYVFGWTAALGFFTMLSVPPARLALKTSMLERLAQGNPPSDPEVKMAKRTMYLVLALMCMGAAVLWPLSLPYRVARLLVDGGTVGDEGHCAGCGASLEDEDDHG